MKERLKQVRQEAGLTQEQFAKKLGMKRNSIANYEIGRNMPLDAVVHSVCREFGINELWLREGQGPMRKPKEGIFSEYLSDLEDGEDQFIQGLITSYMKLTAAEKAVVQKFFKGIQLS